MNRKIIIALLIYVFMVTQIIQGRSIYRPVDPFMPEISVKWVGDSQNIYPPEISLGRIRFVPIIR